MSTSNEYPKQNHHYEIHNENQFLNELKQISNIKEKFMDEKYKNFILYLTDASKKPNQYSTEIAYKNPDNSNATAYIKGLPIHIYEKSNDTTNEIILESVVDDKIIFSKTIIFKKYYDPHQELNQTNVQIYKDNLLNQLKHIFNNIDDNIDQFESVKSKYNTLIERKYFLMDLIRKNNSHSNNQINLLQQKEMNILKRILIISKQNDASKIKKIKSCLEKLIEIQLETRKISNFDPLLWAKNNDYVPIVKIIKNYEGQEYNINGTPSITSKSSDNKSSTQKGGGSKKSTKIQRIIFKNNDIFSNYYVDIKNPLVIDGLKFASVEHYLNYEKYRNYGSGKRKKINNKIAELFVLDNGDNLSKKMLHNYRATNVYTTKIKKSSLLMKALMVKFSKTHNCQLLEKLKKTKDKVLCLIDGNNLIKQTELMKVRKHRLSNHSNKKSLTKCEEMVKDDLLFEKLETISKAFSEDKMDLIEVPITKDSLYYSLLFGLHNREIDPMVSGEIYSLHKTVKITNDEEYKYIGVFHDAVQQLKNDIYEKFMANSLDNMNNITELELMAILFNVNINLYELDSKNKIVKKTISPNAKKYRFGKVYNCNKRNTIVLGKTDKNHYVLGELYRNNLDQTIYDKFFIHILNHDDHEIAITYNEDSKSSEVIGIINRDKVNQLKTINWMNLDESKIVSLQQKTSKIFKKNKHKQLLLKYEFWKNTSTNELFDDINKPPVGNINPDGDFYMNINFN